VYSGGETCQYNENLTYSVEINLYCDEDGDSNEKPTPYFDTIDTTNCIYKLNLRSKEACYKFTMNPLVRWLHVNAYIFGAVILVLGLFVGFFGRILFKPAICAIGTLAFVFFASLLIFSLFFNRDTLPWVEWTVFGVLIVLGLLVGLLLAKLSKLGVFVLAGWGGFCLGLILYNSFIYKLDNSHAILFWIFNILLAIIAGVLSIYFFDHILILTTSLIGSYLFIRGISFYAGGFPDEIDLVNWIQYGFGSIDPVFYAYMAGFFVFSIICIVI